ncbi:hypothetical protein ACFPN4_04340 [Ureibacillus thermophilus]|uniref:Uncharacterized protein n=1 Tax=Ureibacillus thermophilus TaxID=367743 RepID=A0A4P6UTD9_9BACL|nr:hypothetical protein [Ureibacillus thermophilus]QBK26473.1 hypothetical protein DKZ56_11735 [Ureibacillus thermophilus]
MEHRTDLENHARHFEMIRGKQSVGSKGKNMEEFGLEEEFHIPKKKEHPSIRERHDSFSEKE